MKPVRLVKRFGRTISLGNCNFIKIETELEVTLDDFETTNEEAFEKANQELYDRVTKSLGDDLQRIRNARKSDGKTS